MNEDGHCDTRIYALKARWTWSESGFVHGSLVRAALYLSLRGTTPYSLSFLHELTLYLNFVFDLEREIL